MTTQRLILTLDGITAARFLRALADRLEAWPVT